MNIFLLFLTTMLMIGYYVIYSPSQNLEHLDTDSVITMADLRSVAECVIGAQNAGMDSVPYNDACVAKYIDSTTDTPYHYVCTDNSYFMVPCNENPTFNYIVTYSKQLDEKHHASMLKIIEKLYQDKGSLGLYQYSLEEDQTFLITADMSGRRTIAKQIFEEAGLESEDYEKNNGRLVYIMQYQIPYMYSQPVVPGDASSCPEGTIAVQRYGRWLCIEKNPQQSCPHGTEFDETTELCEPISNDDCANACEQLNCGEEETCACYDDGTTECTADDIPTCPDGSELIVDQDTNEYSCYEPEPTEETSPCSDFNDSFLYTNLRTTLGRTARIKNVRCNTKCLKPTRICNAALGAYEYVCMPDPATAYIHRECWPDGTIGQDDCTGPYYGMYFGFTKQSRADGLTLNNGDPIDVLGLIEKGLIPENKRDYKFHCKKCDYGINLDESADSLVVVCKPE